MPSYEDLISGRSALTTIRNVELDDLLGRDPVVLDSAGLAEWLGNRVVLVTGAGGSIGAELCRQIARFRPARLVLFDISEAALYEIQTSLADEFAQLPVSTVVGDVKHAALVDEVLARERPSLVFHAAAYKHVPLMEETNAWQAVRNNAYGTCGARARRGRGEGREVRAGVDRQGGQSDQRDGRVEAARRDRLPEPAGQRHAVRAGALRQRVRQRRQRDPALPGADRARRAGHRHASRTSRATSCRCSEATQLLLQAGLQGRGGEILVLEMGEPVRIVDLARDMIRLSGADPDKIAVVFTGLRPGREALRGAARLRGSDAAHAASEAAHRAGARRESRLGRPDDRVVRARPRRRRRRSARAAEVVDSGVRAARRRPGQADPRRSAVRRGSEGAAAAARAAQALSAEEPGRAQRARAPAPRRRRPLRCARRLRGASRSTSAALRIRRAQAPPRDAVMVATASAHSASGRGPRTTGAALPCR